MSDWLAYLPHLPPLDHIIHMVDLDDDHPDLIAYQEATWLAVSVLKALHIEPELKGALTNLGIKPGMQVLDLGCGAAMKPRFLLDYGVAAVTGLDLDDDELALAQQLPNPYGERLRLLHADALEMLPFADDSFDAVFIGDGFIDFYDDNVMAELKRVVRVGGVIVLATTNILPGTLYAWDRPLAARVEAARWQAMMETGYGEMVEITGETYEIRFLHLCADHGFAVTHIPVLRSNPVPMVFEQLTQHTFCAFSAHTLRPYLSAADWQMLRHLHNPNSADYLFKRTDATFVDLLTVAAATI